MFVAAQVVDKYQLHAKKGPIYLEVSAGLSRPVICLFIPSAASTILLLAVLLAVLLDRTLPIGIMCATNC